MFRRCAAAVVLAGAAVANANPIWSTSFEAPTYTSGVSIAGIEGWANGSGSGASQTATTALAHSGQQSVVFDNNTLVSFYSVRNSGAMAGLNATDAASVSVKLYMSGNTGADRIYGLYLASSATGTMGSTMFGMTIDGAGNIRAGTAWAATYGAGLFATADAGSYTDRWLTINLSWDPVSRAATATMSGFGGANTQFSNGYTLAATPVNPLNVQIGADYVGTTARTGMGFFDDLVVSQIPAPGSLALLGLGGMVAARRRRA